jgi:hypothetical protein
MTVHRREFGASVTAPARMPAAGEPTGMGACWEPRYAWPGSVCELAPGSMLAGRSDRLSAQATRTRTAERLPDTRESTSAQAGRAVSVR